MVAASRRRRAETVVVGEVRQGWEAYGMGSQVDERRSRTPELGVQSGLRAGPREGLGAGVRERLE